MAMGGFDRSVLVSDSRIVASGLQTIMFAEGGIGFGLVLPLGEIAVGGREPVGAMLVRDPTELPESLLQPLGESRKALSAADGFDEAPAGIGEPEMVEQMRKGSPTDGHPELGTMGEVREGLSAGRVLLSEDQLAFRPLGRTPVGDPPLQRAQMAVAIAPRVQALQLFEHGGGPDLGCGLEHRHQFVAPDLGERIRACPVAPALALTGEDRVGFNAPAGAFAEPSPRRRGGLRIPILA